MSIQYRTGKTWNDPQAQGLYHDHRFQGDGRLVVDINLARAIELKKDASLPTKSAWKAHGVVYETVRSSVITLPDGTRVIRLYATED